MRQLRRGRQNSDGVDSCPRPGSVSPKSSMVRNLNLRSGRDVGGTQPSNVGGGADLWAYQQEAAPRCTRRESSGDARTADHTEHCPEAAPRLPPETTHTAFVV